MWLGWGETGGRVGYMLSPRLFPHLDLHSHGSPPTPCPQCWVILARIQKPVASSILGFSREHCGSALTFLRTWALGLGLQLLPVCLSSSPSPHRVAALESHLGLRS